MATQRSSATSFSSSLTLATSSPKSSTLPPSTRAKVQSRFQGFLKSIGRSHSGLGSEDNTEKSSSLISDKSFAPPNEGECIEVSREEKTGLFEWTPFCSNENGFIDVIAVHGLHGDAYETWQCGSQIWLKHFLPKQIPSLRIMSYGYNSAVLFSRSTADAEDFASELLSHLRGKRRTQQEKKRPIIFICHSLGGIVVKQALISAHERSDMHSNILEHTKGIVFMGTPHLGTNAADWPSMLASLVKACTFGTTTNTPLLDELRQNSQLLTRICRQFTGRISNLKILSFYETLKCKGLNQVIVTRDSALLNHDHERACPINADHRSMCRFDGLENPNYKLVLSLITDMVEEIRPPLVDPKIVPLNEKEQHLFSRLMASLFKASTSTTASWNVSLRVDGTCTWILKHTKFLQWQAKDNSSNILWIRGAAGYGKTVLSSFLSEELRKTLPHTLVCSFFCYDKINAEKVLCNIIHQLLSVKQELARHAIPHWERKGEQFAQHWPTLCDIWKSCCNEPSSGNIILVIDALDECGESSRADLLSFLKPLLQQLRMSTDQNKLKILITSRPEVDPVQAFLNVPVSILNLEDETENLPLDVERVISNGVKELIASGQIRSDKADTLKCKLQTKANGTFLWVGMMFKLLRDSMETRALEGLVDNLPEGLSEIYDQLLNRIPSNQQERAMLILKVIIAAQRPLTVSEVDLLLAIQPHHSSEEELSSLAEPSPYRMITNLCGSFIRIVNESGIQYVYLVHQTAKEYLLRSRCLESGQRPPSWRSFSVIDCHLALAVRCIWFLLFRELDTKSLLQWSGKEQKDFEPYVHDYAKNRVLLGYTAAHWAAHFRESESIADAKTISQALSLYDRGSRYVTWSQVYWATQHSPPRIYPPLHMCSHNGHARLLEKLLKESKDSTKDAKDEDGETALHKAVESGHVKAVEVLLQNGVDVTIRDKAWLTALHKAAKANKEAVVQSLLKGGANTDAKLKDESTALHGAAADGLENIVRLLVDGGADVDIPNRDGLAASDLAFNKGYGRIQQFLLDKQTDSGITPLDRAIIDGDEEKVNSLINGGAEFQEKDTRGLTPLHRAARVGNVNIVNILINRGVPKELANDDGATALHVAAKHGNKGVVKALIERNCDVNAKNIDGSRPLHEAVMSGSKGVALLLLNAGASIDSVDDEGETALFHAANLGYLELLQTLVSSGANCYINARKDRTPLHAAAENGHDTIVEYLLGENIFEVDGKDQQEETALTLASRGVQAAHAEVVRVLLENGADPCVKQASLYTPIFLAAERGNDTSMRWLLKDPRVDPDERDQNRLTPLVMAAKNGHENALLMLLDHGAKSVNNNRSKRSPLSWAAEHGLGKAVKRLLEFHDVEINAPDENCRTPLSWAAGTGHLTVVGCLVKDKRIEIDYADANSRTPLSWAAQEGHESVVSLLLGSGSNPALRDNEFGRAPISWAAQGGHDSIVQLLLERDPDASTSSIDRENSSLLCLAAAGGHESTVKFLLNYDESYLNQSDVGNRTPLYLSATEGHEDVVRILLTKSAVDVNLQTRAGTSPLASAAFNGHQGVVEQLLKHDHITLDTKNNYKDTALSAAAIRGHDAVVRMLIDRGADQSILNTNNDSPLHLAARGGHFAVVKLLVRNGKQILARNTAGRTPLWEASDIGSEEVVKELLSANPVSEHHEASHRDYQGQTPLFAAAKNGHAATVRRLLTVPAFSPDAQDNAGHTPLSIAVQEGHRDVIAILLEREPQVNITDADFGRTPLLWACALGRTDLIQLLIQTKDVKKDVRDKDNASPILLASSSGSEGAVKLLLDNGAGDLNAAEIKFGRSPLSIAANNGHASICRLLLSQDAVDPNLRAKSGETALLLAVSAGHESVVRLLLDSPMVDIGLVDHWHWSPMLAASAAGCTNILRLLIHKSRGQDDLNTSKHSQGISPMYCAAEQGHTATVQLLLSHGAKPNVRRGKDKRTPLMIAAANGFYEIVKMLLTQDGVEIEARDLWGDTALTLAAVKGNDDVVQLLLDKGACPNTRDYNHQRTPLMDAAFLGHEKVTRLLLAHKDIEPDCETDAGLTALWFVCSSADRKQQNWQIFNMILDHNVRPDSNHILGKTPLMAASAQGDYEMARVLLEKNADPGLKDKYDHSTALIWAARNGSESIVRMLLNNKDGRVDPDAATLDNKTSLTYAAELGHEGIVRLLLNLDPPVSLEHRTESKGRTPLMYAALGGHESIVRVLLKQNVDLNTYDKYGRTPLIHAIQSGSKGIVEELVKKNARLNVRDKDGTTPLIWAAYEGQNAILRLFLGKTDAKARDRQGRTAFSYAAGFGYEETMHILVNEGELEVSDINTKDKHDYTPATWTIINGHPSALRLLHEMGANLDIRDRNGRSLLSHAARNGCLRALRFLLSQNQQDVNSQDEAGRTPLSWAAENGHDTVVRLLLENGADMEIKDKKMKTPRSYAVDNDQKVLARLLDSQSASESQRPGRILRLRSQE